IDVADEFIVGLEFGYQFVVYLQKRFNFAQQLLLSPPVPYRLHCVLEDALGARGYLEAVALTKSLLTYPRKFAVYTGEVTDASPSISNETVSPGLSSTVIKVPFDSSENVKVFPDK